MTTCEDPWRVPGSEFVGHPVRRSVLRMRHGGWNVRCWMTLEDFNCVTTMYRRAAEKTFQKMKHQHIRKLERLRESSRMIEHSRNVDRTRRVVNLSRYELTTEEKGVLSLGLNFSPAPRKIPYMDIAAAVEDGGRRILAGEASELREKVCSILKGAKPPKANVTKEQRRALKLLKEKDGVVILPADKGNAKVVMDEDKYEEKMRTHLETPVYRKVSKDPTGRYEKKIMDTLKDLKRKRKLDEATVARLRPTASKIPRLYGLPKIQKPDVPLWSIVSSINSPTYHLVKLVTQLIGPLAGPTTSFVKNSKHYVEQIKESVMVSFDVKSLFTNVPLDEALQVIRDRLSQDTSLEERTRLSADNLTHLLELCLTSTYFSFKGELYEQTEGAAMGSPVSPVVATMEHFEDLAVMMAPNPPRVWKWYVDDIFCILKKTTVEETLSHLNSIHPIIQFTVEEEQEGILPFLDTQLQRGRERTMDVTVFRKKTHTDHYLQFESHHPMHVKRGVMRSLFNRTQAVTLEEENVHKEEDHLEGVLQENGYPRSFIQKSPERRPQLDEEEQSHRTTVVIPYVAELSERVRRVYKD